MMGDESWRDGSVVHRHLHLLNTELKADCSFIVGISEKKQFRCHKSILSYGSPVFDVMFNGDLEEKGDVNVEDIEPQHFRKMLEYIYSDNTELENVESALSVCYAANKYMINTLTLKCIDFSKKNLSNDVVCRALEFARLIENPDLEDTSLLYLKLHTGDVLKSLSFPNAERETLLTILEQDEDICIASEVEVFSACIRWAKAQPRDATVTLREVLGPDVLGRIRFLSMTARQFVTFVVPTKLLKVQEERDILCCIAVGPGNMPLGFTKNAKNRAASIGPQDPMDIEIHRLCGIEYNKY
ncbi:hypothetical protein B566_EDAN013082 [Ephemera danica]|nr:hypothetical protein B566_EDAN013082 [Ephemera danica]